MQASGALEKALLGMIKQEGKHDRHSVDWSHLDECDVGIWWKSPAGMLGCDPVIHNVVISALPYTSVFLRMLFSTSLEYTLLQDLGVMRPLELEEMTNLLQQFAYVCMDVCMYV